MARDLKSFLSRSGPMAIPSAVLHALETSCWARKSPTLAKVPTSGSWVKSCAITVPISKAYKINV